MTIKAFEAEIEEVKQKINMIKNFVDEGAKMLGTKTTLSNCQKILDAKLKEYEQVGSFARHYSITRSGVLTFLVGLSFAITGALIKGQTSGGISTVIFNHGISLSFSILLIAFFFDRFLCIYLLAANGRGITLEYEINEHLGIEPKNQIDNKGLKYFINLNSRISQTGWFDLIDGPAYALWIVIVLYFFFGKIVTGNFPIVYSILHYFGVYP